MGDSYILRLNFYGEIAKNVILKIDKQKTITWQKCKCTSQLNNIQACKDGSIFRNPAVQFILLEVIRKINCVIMSLTWIKAWGQIQEHYQKFEVENDD